MKTKLQKTKCWKAWIATFILLFSFSIVKGDDCSATKFWLWQSADDYAGLVKGGALWEPDNDGTGDSGKKAVGASDNTGYIQYVFNPPCPGIYKASIAYRSGEKNDTRQTSIRMSPTDTYDQSVIKFATINLNWPGTMTTLAGTGNMSLYGETAFYFFPGIYTRVHYINFEYVGPLDETIEPDPAGSCISPQYYLIKTLGQNNGYLVDDGNTLNDADARGQLKYRTFTSQADAEAESNTHWLFEDGKIVSSTGRAMNGNWDWSGYCGSSNQYDDPYNHNNPVGLASNESNYFVYRDGPYLRGRDSRYISSVNLCSNNLISMKQTADISKNEFKYEFIPINYVPASHVDLQITNIAYTLTDGVLTLNNITIKNNGNKTVTPSLSTPIKLKFKFTDSNENNKWRLLILTSGNSITAGSTQTYSLNSLDPVLVGTEPYMLNTLVYGIVDSNCDNNEFELEINSLQVDICEEYPTVELSWFKFRPAVNPGWNYYDAYMGDNGNDNRLVAIQTSTPESDEFCQWYLMPTGKKTSDNQIIYYLMNKASKRYVFREDNMPSTGDWGFYTIGLSSERKNTNAYKWVIKDGHITSLSFYTPTFDETTNYWIHANVIAEPAGGIGTPYLVCGRVAAGNSGRGTTFYHQKGVVDANAQNPECAPKLTISNLSVENIQVYAGTAIYPSITITNDGKSDQTDPFTIIFTLGDTQLEETFNTGILKNESVQVTATRNFIAPEYNGLYTIIADLNGSQITLKITVIEGKVNEGEGDLDSDPNLDDLPKGCINEAGLYIIKSANTNSGYTNRYLYDSGDPSSSGNNDRVVVKADAFSYSNPDARALWTLEYTYLSEEERPGYKITNKATGRILYTDAHRPGQDYTGDDGCNWNGVFYLQSKDNIVTNHVAHVYFSLGAGNGSTYFELGEKADNKYSLTSRNIQDWGTDRYMVYRGSNSATSGGDKVFASQYSANNSRFWEIKEVPSCPDLLVSEINVTTSTITLGQSFDASIKIKNEGLVPMIATEESPLKIKFKINDKIDSVLYTKTLDAGAESELLIKTITPNSLMEGVALTVVVNSNGNISECDYKNNTKVSEGLITVERPIANMVSEIKWTGKCGTWDRLANWEKKVDNDWKDLTAYDTFAESLTVTIPALEGKNYPSIIHPAGPSVVRAATESHHVTNLNIHYGASTLIAPFIGNKCSNVRTSLKVSARENWILVGSNLMPWVNKSTRTKRMMRAGDFDLGGMPHVYLNKMSASTKEVDGKKVAEVTWGSNTISDIYHELTPGTGYAILVPDQYGPFRLLYEHYALMQGTSAEPNANPNSDAYEGKQSVEFTFEGNFLDINNNNNLYKFMTDKGNFVVVSNTLMSNISVKKLLSLPGAENDRVAVWGLNNESGSVFIPGSFITYGSDVNDDITIKPMHAFLYYSDQEDRIINLLDLEGDICDLSRSTHYSMARSVDDRNPALTIVTTDGKYAAQSTIVYDPEAMDNQNLIKVFTGGAEYQSIPNIFIDNEEQLLQTKYVNSLYDEIPLGVKLEEAATVTFTATGTDEFDEVYLLDKETDTTYDLTIEDQVIELNLLAGYNTDRFVVKFKVYDPIITDVPGTKDDNSLKVYTEDNEHVVVSTSANEKITNITIVNMAGGLVKSLTNTNSYTVVDMSAYPAGVYTVKASTPTETKVTKVVIR